MTVVDMSYAIIRIPLMIPCPRWSQMLLIIESFETSKHSHYFNNTETETGHWHPGTPWRWSSVCELVSDSRVILMSLRWSPPPSETYCSNDWQTEYLDNLINQCSIFVHVLNLSQPANTSSTLKTFLGKADSTQFSFIMLHF